MQFCWYSKNLKKRQVFFKIFKGFGGSSWASWGHVKPPWGHLEAKLSHVEAKLRPTWATCGFLDPTCCQNCPNMPPNLPMWLNFGPPGGGARGSNESAFRYFFGSWCPLGAKMAPIPLQDGPKSQFYRFFNDFYWIFIDFLLIFYWFLFDFQ